MIQIKTVRPCSKIKILYVISRLNIGGPAVHVKTLVRNLDENKYVTRIVTGRISPNEGDMRYIFTQKERSKFLYLTRLQREISPLNDILSLFKLFKIIIQFDPDIIDSHTSKAGVLSRIAAFFCNFFRKKKIITLHTFHGNVFGGYFEKFKSLFFLRIEQILGRITDRIIVLSKSQQKELAECYKIVHPEKINIVNLGFDLRSFKGNRLKKGTFREKIGVNSDVILIGIVGRLAPIKNHYLFFDAAKQVLKHHDPKKIKFVVVGDGELRSALEDHVFEQNLSDAVIFCGWEKDISVVYADLDLLALTSVNEGTPVSIIEAMAASVPVISTDVGGIRDLFGRIDKNVSTEAMGFSICERGVLCAQKDPSAFADGILYLLKGKNAQRISSARAFVLNNYTDSVLVERMEKTYDQVLRQHPFNPIEVS